MINKIKITLLIISIGIPNLILAQKVELTLGTGISKFNFKQVNYPHWMMPYETLEYNYIFSAICGAKINYNLKNNIDYNAGINYSTKGSNEYKVSNSYFINTPDTTFISKENVTRRLHYLELPMTIHFRKIYAFAGAQISYLWGESYHYHEETTFMNLGQAYDVYTQEERTFIDFYLRGWYNHLDLGMILGFEYPIHKKFNIALQYYQGVRNILLNSEDNYVNYKNSQLLFTLSYCISKNKEE